MCEKKDRALVRHDKTFHKLNIYVFTFFSLLGADFRASKRQTPQPHEEFYVSNAVDPPIRVSHLAFLVNFNLFSHLKGGR